MAIKITMDSVIHFLQDEGLAPVRIKKKDTYDFELAINEPAIWGSNDHKMRCGIGSKDIEHEDGIISKEVLFHCFKAYAKMGSDYSGHWFKFVKNIKNYETIQEAKDYFIENYLLHSDLDIVTKSNPGIIDKPSAGKVIFKEHFEKLNLDNAAHKPYISYLSLRGVPANQIKKNKIFIDQVEKRIVFPVYEAGRLVFYTGRDITGISPLRWKKSEGGKGVHPIWNLDAVESNIVLVFEGIFDAIYFHNGIALLGVGSEKQFKKILGKGFSKIVLIFDNDDAGRKAKIDWAKWLQKRNYERVFVYDYNGIEEKDFSSMIEHGIDPQISLRTFHWDYKTEIRFKMGQLK